MKIKKANVFIGILVFLISVVLVVLVFGKMNTKTTIVGNPDYEDSLYTSKDEFVSKFEYVIKDYDFNKIEKSNGREFTYEFPNEMNLRVGTKSDGETLSFIIFSWKKDFCSDEAINICKALYKIIDPEVSEDTIRNNLIEIGAMDEEINYADYKGYYPKKNVRFAIEEKDGILKLYINDEAMGY